MSYLPAYWIGSAERQPLVVVVSAASPVVFALPFSVVLASPYAVAVRASAAWAVVETIF